MQKKKVIGEGKNSPYALPMLKSFFFLSLLLPSVCVLFSCGSSEYFLKQVDEDDPHASLSLRNGTTQVVKIDGKYAPEEALYSIRLKPGKHLIEVTHQASQIGGLGAFLGLPGRDLSASATMEIDLVPGRSYRPECNVSGSQGAVFYLVDQNGLRTNLTRAATQTY